MFRHVSSQLLPNWLNLFEIVGAGKARDADQPRRAGRAFLRRIRRGHLAAELSGGAGAGRPSRTSSARAGPSRRSISLPVPASGASPCARASRLVRVRAIDWPDVLHVTRRVAGRFHVGDRFTYVAGGDLVDADFGGPHQIATLGQILHSEGEERSRALLRRTHAAMAPGGTIAIAEFLVDADRRGPMSGLIFAVNMAVNTQAGGTYSFEEISGWLVERLRQSPSSTRAGPVAADPRHAGLEQGDVKRAPLFGSRPTPSVMYRAKSAMVDCEF